VNPEERDRSPLPLSDFLVRAVPLALICAAACAGAAGLLSAQRESVYESTALVLTRQNADPVIGSTGDDEGEGVATDALFVSSPPVLAAARRRADDLTVDELKESVTAAAVTGTNAVQVTGSASRPQRAALIANAVSRAFISMQRRETMRRARQARRVLDDQLDRLSDESRASLPGVQLRERIQGLLVLEELGGPAPRLIDAAEPPETPVRPRPRRDAVFGGIFGLVLGAGLAALWVASDRRIRSVREASEVLGAPTLATFRRRSRFRPGKGARARSDEEAWRLVHLRLRHGHQRDPLRTVAVTTVTSGQGRSRVAWGLAATAAAAGERTLFIGLEPEQRDLNHQPRAVTANGLGAVLAGDATLSQAVTRVPVHGSGEVDVLIASSRNGHPLALGETPQLGDTVRDASAAYELVVIDTPSLLERAEGVPVISEADATVVVVSERVDREDAVALRERLAALHARAVGVVVSRG
jgi:Mrp family chromosome partitioning ATPase